MPNVPDYSQYIGVKKISSVQKTNTNTAVAKGRAPSRFDGYFPMYRGIGLPVNALVSNKFTQSGTPAAPPSPPPFGPLDIANCSLWLDGADSTKLTLSGTDVTGWTDKSTLGNNYQATSGNYPTYSIDSSGYNKYGVFFDGINDHMLPTNSLLRSVNSSQWTTFLVIRLTGSNDNYMSVYRSNPSGLWVRYNVSGTTWSFYIPSSEIAPSQTLANSNGLYVDVVSTTSHSLYQNGTQFGTSAGGNSTVYSETLTLGGNGTTESMTGYMFEIIIYNSVALATLDRQKVEGYLAWKWGLQTQLPSNHPYKTAAP